MPNILFNGCTGMIGRYLVDQLTEGGYPIRFASLEGKELCNQKTIFKRLDLRDYFHALDVPSSMTFIMDNEISTPVYFF